MRFPMQQLLAAIAHVSRSTGPAVWAKGGRTKPLARQGRLWRAHHADLTPLCIWE